MRIRTLLNSVIVPTTLFILSSCGKNDDNPPVLTLVGEPSMTIFTGEQFSDPKAKAIDDKDGDISDKVYLEGKVSINKAGEYVIKYHAQDKAGNQATALSRTVYVKHKNATIAGEYSVSEACNFGNVGPYDASVTASPDDVTNVTMQNFGDYTTTVNLAGSLAGNTGQEFKITSDQVFGGIVYNGSGNISADGRIITINYSAKQGSTEDQCTATWTRK